MKSLNPRSSRTRQVFQPAEGSQSRKNLKQQRTTPKLEVPNQRKGLNQGRVSINGGILSGKFPNRRVSTKEESQPTESSHIDEVPNQQKGLNQEKSQPTEGSFQTRRTSQPAEGSQPLKSLNPHRDPLKPDKFPNQQKGLNQGGVATNRGILPHQRKFPTSRRVSI